MVSTTPAQPATEVFVVGGGPAGLAAAIAARQQGFAVTVADIARPPIDKACGEGLMPDSIAALRSLGIDADDLDTGIFRGIRFIGEVGTASAEFLSGPGRGIRRTVLHDRMVQAAHDAGVVMRWGARVSGVQDGAVILDGQLVSCRWIVGADGQNSQVRRWAGLTAGHEYERRVGLRRHFGLVPWSDAVEIYWGKRGQAYVTPVGNNEVCVALIVKRAHGDFDALLQEFPTLARRLQGAPALTDARGAVTVTRRLKSVTRGRFALVGEASGSTDAVTGEGLAMSFHHAIALARALRAGDLSRYEKAHRGIHRLPHLMGRTMLLMDKSPWVRDRALRALSARPELFRRLLAVHVGDIPLAQFGVPGFVHLGWRILTA